jgi:hypothetical protein
MHPTRIFKTPEELEIAFENYKEYLKDEAYQWVKIQYVGKDGERKSDPQKVPYTLEGFKRFCRKYYGCVNEYFLNRNGLYDDFNTICSHIKEEIRENQITGGLLGFFNPSITQRLNGLKEQTETELNAKVETITGMEIK